MIKTLLKFSQSALEAGLLPDVVIRWGIRRLLAAKLADEKRPGVELVQAKQQEFVNQLKASPIALHTRAANEQHYEVPTDFFRLVMGQHLKYSSGYWREGITDLTQAESDMLEITTERADLKDGQSILELGCGWGSLSLFMAKKFPHCRIIGVSNSRTQKNYIDAQIAIRGLRNLEIVTADMNDFSIHTKFDRVVSVEMFEHMRNYQLLLEKVAGFLKSEGRLFVHIFTHKEFAYPYEENDDADWIGKYFFTGGIMPSDTLLLNFQDHFKIENHWRVAGTHYQKTSEAWLKNMDARREEVWPILSATYGEAQAKKWWNYWRVFFMSCAELWGYRQGTEWIVSHYLFKKR